MAKKVLIVKKNKEVEKMDKYKICPICNKEFIVKSKHQTYCSNACRKEGIKQGKKLYMESIKDKLKDYNKNYYETVTKAKREKLKENKVKPTYVKVCPICNKEFTTNKHQQKYCSSECKEISIKQNMKEYIKTDKYKEYMKEYMKSSKYKEVRKNYYKNQKLKIQEAQTTITELQKQVEKLTKKLNKVKKGK